MMEGHGPRFLESSVVAGGTVADDSSSYNGYQPWMGTAAEQQQQYLGQRDITYTDRQLKTGIWTTRISSAIALISAILVVWRAWKRRKMVFHQLILGMGIHLTIAEACKVIGPAAIPKDSDNALQNHGNIGTCAIQGFLIYVSAMTACLYYCSFSVYSYVGILCNFDQSAIERLKFVIHLAVHFYPLGSGMYLLYMELFNNTGFGYCFIETVPLGCTDADVCIRGDISPRNSFPRMILEELFWNIPLWVMVVGSTSTMVTLYFKVRCYQDKVLIPASSVAMQSLYYLLLFYVGVIPHLFIETTWWTKDLSTTTYHHLTLFGNVMFTLAGVWMGMMYAYFSYKSTELPTEMLDESLHPVSTDDFHNETRNTIHGPFIFSSENFLTTPLEKVEELETTTGIPSQNGAGRKDAKPVPTVTLEQRKPPPPLSEPKRQYSFNIFDGTNATGAYASYIFDGDSDDERVDDSETRKWSAVQDRI